MKKHSKVLLTLLCAVLLVVGSVMGTLAYLTDSETVTNTFTVGKVGISLAETDVDGDKDVLKNAYDLLPGHTYVKDPKVTVDADSEESYIRMLVTVSDMSKLMAAMPKDKFPTFYNGDLFLLQNLCVDEDGKLTWDGAKWLYEGYKDGTYEFRYYQTVSTKDKAALPLEPLFTDITVPGDVTNTQLANLEGIKIDVVAHAIQKDGFENADLAWAEFPTT